MAVRSTVEGVRYSRFAKELMDGGAFDGGG